jgi:hypothetical protein
VKRPNGLSWRPDGWIFVVRTIFFLESRLPELSRPDRDQVRPDSRGNQRPDGKDKSSGRARPVHMVPRQPTSGWHKFTTRTGIPQRLYIPWAPHAPPYPTKISLFGILCIIFCEFLALCCFLLSFCTLRHSRYFPILFFSVLLFLNC